MGLTEMDHPLLARYAEIRAEAAEKYGPDSQAVVFLLYEELLSLRTVLVQDRSAGGIGRRVRELVAGIQQRYEAGGMADSGRDHRLVGTDPVIIEYDREVFERRYRDALATCGVRVLHVTTAAEAFAGLRPGRTYIYALDDEYRLLVWPEPFSLAEMVFGRAPEQRRHGTRVVHPMLVPDRLRVRAAGELVILGRAADCMVVANMKSGHFRPPPQCAEALREVLLDVFAARDEDIDIFTVPQPISPPVPRPIPLP
jgi:hypothetical protein